MKVAMFGTFDIANFGDILFPIVTEAMLRRACADVELVRYSYRAKSAPEWPYDVRPIEQLADDLPQTDLVLIGGGHLIHANPSIAPGYRPPDATLPHPFGFWWLPAVAARMAGVPVALHAPSVEARFPDWTRPLCQAFAESLDYASARDERSLQRLKSFGAIAPVLVPDTIFSIPHLIERGKYSPDFERFRIEHGLTAPYLIVQPSGGLRGQRNDIDRLIAEAFARGWQVLELPIFQEHLNKSGLFGNVKDVVQVKRDPHPLLLAEIIANSHGAVGVSLHLSIVSTAFGVPVYRKRYQAESKFILLDGLPGIRFLDENVPLQADVQTPAPQISEFAARLDRHYERLVAMAEAGPDRERRLVGWTMLKQLPNAMKREQGARDRARAARLRLIRMKHFAAARLAMPVDRALGLFR